MDLSEYEQACEAEPHRILPMVSAYAIAASPPSPDLPRVELIDVPGDGDCFWHALAYAEADGQYGNQDPRHTTGPGQALRKDFNTKLALLDESSRRVYENTKLPRINGAPPRWGGTAEMRLITDHSMLERTYPLYYTLLTTWFNGGISITCFPPKGSTGNLDPATRWVYLIGNGSHWNVAKVDGEVQCTMPRFRAVVSSIKDRVLSDPNRHGRALDLFAKHDDGHSLLNLLCVLNDTTYFEDRECREVFDPYLRSRFPTLWNPRMFFSMDGKENMALALWFPLREERDIYDASVAYPRSLAMKAARYFLYLIESAPDKEKRLNWDKENESRKKMFADRLKSNDDIFFRAMERFVFSSIDMLGYPEMVVELLTKCHWYKNCEINSRQLSRLVATMKVAREKIPHLKSLLPRDRQIELAAYL